ncbi:alpha-L-rhamnosidase [Echinimonas agarilytica]|uniref:alpha-L-rhamnosidase n=1 Tax=Echinimonas agarilytica TaxID=1215918 RepID=A0AA41W9N1_9GAMM|nr:alpha-L-rhamnosidase [Echinimonas agarilytica]MCM2680676.1 glycoside hydrolase family 78 protein [Echinimonas agarilytica]
MIRPLSIMSLVLALFACSVGDEQQISTAPSTLAKPSGLLVEENQRPLNVHHQTPRLSWLSNVKKQAAFQIQVASSEALLTAGNSDYWDSGKVASGQSVNIAYGGKPLASKAAAAWRVRVWPEGDLEPSAWSATGIWEMGLIHKSDWQAQWLQVKQRTVAKLDDKGMNWVLYAANVHPESNDTLNASKKQKQLGVVEQLKAQPTASLFRYDFTVDSSKKLVKARLHSTSAGYYEVFLNGKKVDDRMMDPGQTDFDQRILYNTDDVESLLAVDQNTIAVHLGSGWYDENIAFSRWNNPDQKVGPKAKKTLSYGQPKFIAQLEITYDDGTTQMITTNKDWLSHSSPILKEGIFSGELYDANAFVEGWNRHASSAQLMQWQPVQVLQQWPTKQLEPQLLPAIRAVKAMVPIKIYQPKDKVWVFDFGQNFTAVPTLNLAKLDLKAGQTISLRYAEWADIEGNISQKTGGGAPLLKQVDTYIASGDDPATWAPIFTWHGFRYVEVTGLHEQPQIDALTADLVRSDVAVAGQFKSSNALLNQIHDMALWSYESNLMAVPLDCPIRERAGWTGDAHAALITGNYNFNMANLWQKYLVDFQTATYVAPAVVPGKRTHGGNFDWAVAEVMIAWEHYKHHGDVQILEDQYESMQEYMQAGEAKLENDLLRIGYGDWCDPVLKPGMGRKRCNPQHTSPTITSSALFAHGADLMSKIASLLGRGSDSEHYGQLFRRLSDAFNAEFYSAKTGHYGSQTADAMALRFGMTPPDLRQSVADALNRDVVETWKGHGSIGALGQTYVYRALSDYGYGDTAYNIFVAEGYPGYAWQMSELGATTLWERKGVYDPTSDPMRKEAPGRSLNHPFHSGYDGWFYEGLGGIRPLADNPGFQHFELAPVFPSNLDSVQVSYQTGYGNIVSDWQRGVNTVEWHFEVPNNTTARVQIPNQPAKVYGPGHYDVSIAVNDL